MFNRISADHKKAIVFVIIVFLAFKIGSYMITATFFGLVSLVGLVVLIESIPPIKWIMSRSTQLLDVMIFLFTIIATAKFGLNITASLTMMGIGYTLVYAPYLRRQRVASKPKDKVNYKNKFNAK